MPRLWVYSPIQVTSDALVAYLGALGFDAQAQPDGAALAVFDLTPFAAPLPPAPGLPCVAIVRSTDPGTRRDLRQLGYRGAVLPEHGGTRLAEAIAELMSGHMSGAPPASETDDGPSEHVAPNLTHRETQVLGLLMLGLPNKRIASRLGITERTTKHHVSSLMRKYQARGRLGLVLKSRTDFRA